MKKLILAFLSVCLLTGCGCSLFGKSEVKKEDESVELKDENLLRKQNINGIILENTLIEVSGGISTVVTKITNTTGSSFELKNYEVSIYDKNNQFLVAISSNVNQVIEPGADVSYPTTFNFDLTYAGKVEYRVNYE